MNIFPKLHPQSSFVAVCALLALVSLLACRGPAETTPAPEKPEAKTLGTQPARALASAVEAFTEPPERDLYLLAARLNPEAPKDIPRVVNERPVSYQQGREDTFWVLNLNSLEYAQRAFDLRLVTPHAYWYIDQGQEVFQEELENAAREFEDHIYPTVTSIFGTEWSPGVDNDPHLNIINSRFEGAAGYFSSGDEYPVAVSPFSNQREIIYINIDAVPVDSTSYLDVLAHELQHAIHWNADPSEDTWINEGLSELSVSLAGYGDSSARRFLRSGPNSLVHWPMSGVGSQASYGAASLFMHYLLEHYGNLQDLRPLVSQPQDGVAGVNAFLKSQGHQTTFRQVFADWIAANYLDQFEPGLVDQRYRYANLKISAKPTRLLDSHANLETQLPQFAPEYVQLRSLSGPTRIRFSGISEVALLPVAVGAQGCWWSNVGDSIDSTLTRALDLGGNVNPTLAYQVWYELEEDWDYTYLEVSLDGGESWQILETPHTSEASQVTSNFGPGYTGESGGWLTESIDLGSYAGQKILLRFQYVTDDAINGSGLCLRGFSGTATDSWQENWREGWQADGFVLVDNRVRQEFVVRVIQVGSEISVTSMDLDSKNTGELIIQTPQALDRLVVVVGAMAAKTRQPAGYQLVVEAVE